MWTVIYIASTEKMADRICARLTDEGFLVKRRLVSGARPQFEILVPETELDDVKELLTDILHSSLP